MKIKGEYEELITRLFADKSVQSKIITILTELERYRCLDSQLKQSSMATNPSKNSKSSKCITKLRF